jgi:hypothetical protein
MATSHRHPSADRRGESRRAQPVSVSRSILRMSVGERLLAVSVVIAALWAAVRWAVS